MAPLKLSSVEFSPTGALFVWEGSVDSSDPPYVILSAADCEWAAAREDSVETPEEFGRLEMECQEDNEDFVQVEISGFEDDFIINDEVFRFSELSIHLWGESSNCDPLFKKSDAPKFALSFSDCYESFRLEVKFAKVKASGTLVGDLLALYPRDFVFVCGPKKTRVAGSKIVAAARSGKKARMGFSVSPFCIFLRF